MAACFLGGHSAFPEGLQRGPRRRFRRIAPPQQPGHLHNCDVTAVWWGAARLTTKRAASKGGSLPRLTRRLSSSSWRGYSGVPAAGSGASHHLENSAIYMTAM
jgi:hypothetical protein